MISYMKSRLNAIEAGSETLEYDFMNVPVASASPQAVVVFSK